MRIACLAIVAVIGLSCTGLSAGAATADNPGGAKPSKKETTKPHMGNGPKVEKSLPSSAPAATTTGSTGSTAQDKTVKAMNSQEKAKVEAGGK